MKGLSKGAIVAIVLVLAFVLIITIIMLILLKKRVIEQNNKNRIESSVYILNEPRL